MPKKMPDVQFAEKSHRSSQEIHRSVGSLLILSSDLPQP
jgi:hypothetical protein